MLHIFNETFRVLIERLSKYHVICVACVTYKTIIYGTVNTSTAELVNQAIYIQVK